ARGRGASTGPLAPPGRAGLAVVDAGAPGAAAAAAPVARRTSSSEIRPPGPVPRTRPRSTPSSRARRRVAGVAAGATPVAGAGDVGAAAGAGAAARAGAVAAGVAGTLPFPPSPKLSRTAPTFTRWPAWTCAAATRPPNGEGSSTCAFSVSTRRTAWSSLISSPSATRTRTISASVRPSPRSGSLNSLAMGGAPRAGGRLEGERLPDGAQHAVRSREPSALAREARVDDVERGDAPHGRLELEERGLDDPRHDLGADAEAPLGLVGHDHAARLARRRGDRLGVHGRDRQEVDHLDLGAVLRVDALRDLQAAVEHRAVGD